MTFYEKTQQAIDKIWLEVYEKMVSYAEIQGGFEVQVQEVNFE